MNKKFKVILILLLLLAVLPLLPATNYQLLTVRADWNTNFNLADCSFSFSPGSPVIKGATVILSAQTDSNSKITELKINGRTVTTGAAPAITYTWNTGESQWSTGSYTITAKTLNAAGNYGDCNGGNFQVNAPAPSPSPQVFNKTIMKVEPQYCTMNWYQSYCPNSPTLYYFTDANVRDFYIQVDDTGWGSRRICDTTWTWSSSAQCSRTNWYTRGLLDRVSPWLYWQLLNYLGEKRQVSPFTLSSNNSATKYTMRGKTSTDPNYYKELAYAYGVGLRTQMPAPYVYYLDNRNCQAANVSNSAYLRINFPIPPWPYSYEARPIMYVYISEDPNFSTYYYKEVNRFGRTPPVTYTDAPVGFTNWSGGPLTIEPNKIYYVRLYGYWYDWSTRWYNGYTEGWYSGIYYFYRPLCAINGGWCSLSPCSNTCGSGQKVQTNCNCPAPANGGADCPAAQSQACTDYTGCTFTWEQSGWTSCPVSCGGGDQTQSVWCQRSDGTTVPDTNCSGAGPKPLTSRRCNEQACLTPWIQTEGGDVHSNTRISAPGGP